MRDIVTDFEQFAVSRKQARDGDARALETVAEQFEALFLQTMLKSMRKATPGDPIFGASQHDSTYQQMFDQQLASELASSPGIGLAEVLTRQLAGGQAISGVAEIDKAGPVNTPATPTEKVTPREFARRLWPYANRVAAELGTDPRAVLAQAALETGWGQKTLSAGAGNSSNNFFGIKAGGNWQGAEVSVPTLEYEDGVAKQEIAKFRAYENVAAGLSDYQTFLSENPRYQRALGHGSDIEAFANGLQSAGYATDPKYAEKIVDVANGKTMRQVLSSLNAGGLSVVDSQTLAASLPQ